MSVFTKESIHLGAELPPISRQWSLELFTDRHETVYGPGNIIREQWSKQNLHSDYEAAQREGLKAPVASAPQIFAQIHRAMMMTFGKGWIAGGKISVKMAKSVYPEDFTTAKGRVIGLSLEVDEEGNQRTRAMCDVWVERRDGVKVMVGSASALLE